MKLEKLFKVLVAGSLLVPAGGCAHEGTVPVAGKTAAPVFQGADDAAAKSAVAPAADASAEPGPAAIPIEVEAEDAHPEEGVSSWLSW